MPAARWGARMGETKMVDTVTGALTDPVHSVLMGVTAENLAERGSISRERQDEFAVESHRRAAAARAPRAASIARSCRCPVPGKRESVEFVRDEHIREDASLESLRRLKPVFKPDGTVTAGNASGMNDAGAALVLMSARRAPSSSGSGRGRGSSPTPPAGSIRRSWASGPSRPCAACSSGPGRSLDEVEVIELNEAFAAQALAVIDDLGLDPAKVNPNGGAIALGHPIGATGAAITTKILDDMEDRDLSSVWSRSASAAARGSRCCSSACSESPRTAPRHPRGWSTNRPV